MASLCHKTPPQRAGRLLFLSATPANVEQGSGTYVGIETLRRALEGLGVEVEYVAPQGGRATTWARLWFNWRLRRQPTDAIVVGFDLDGLFLPGRGVASLKGVRAEEARFERGWTRARLKFEAWLEGWRARRAARVLVTSRYAAEAAQRIYGVAAERIRIVPELIDLDGWREWLGRAPAPRRLSPRPAPLILCVAHLYPRKDVGTLLLAMAQLDSDVKLHIVGEGPERRRLEHQAQRLGLGERVQFLGHIPRLALAREYLSADIFCLPSRQEGFGIVLLEAMAAGVPIVAARATAIPEVVPEPECGRLFPPGDAGALAQTLRELLGDAGQRQRMAAAGRHHVERYAAPRVAAEFLAAMDWRESAGGSGERES
ncbi:MAG TPA: glycosyltransferase family 4 protein [Terriglobales bacterium]